MSKFHFALAYMSASLFTAKTAREEKGATAVEYGLLVALIAAIIVVAVALLGTKITGAFSSINSKL
ncbi:Flp family type IVb pilin [Aeromicrobium fastidiosum]|nr:Flp family type IVb pilin [Aeromicrobium fastidiosum]MBP2389146.1 pilus assembly protein Flp/PilA [Aeromicrobium fastidiosum]